MKALVAILLLAAATPAQSTPIVSTVIPNINASGDVSIGVDGAIYIADFGATISKAGGTNVYRMAVGGTPAVFSTGFGGASGNEFGPDGMFYQSDVARGEVYRIEPDGRRTRIAEGLKSPVGIAPGNDGAIYVVQCLANEITRIGPDQLLTTVAKGPPLNCPNGLAFGPDGALYSANFRDGAVVRISLPHGVTTRVATIPGGSNGHLAWANGRFYVASYGGNRLYELSLDGSVCPLAGTGERGNADGDGASATFFRPNGMAITADGDALFTNTVLIAQDAGDPGLHPNALRKVSGLKSRPACAAQASGERG